MVATILAGRSSGPFNSRHILTAPVFLSHKAPFVSLCLFFGLFLNVLAQTGSDGLGELFGLDSHANHEDVFIRTKAPRNAFPFYVSLQRGDLGLHYCAGTLISPSYVLTSASCMDPKVSGFGVENAKAVVGAYELELEQKHGRNEAHRRKGSVHCNPKAIAVKEVFMHEKYSNGTDGHASYNARYDIAVVRLKKQADFSWAALPFEAPADCCEGVDFVNIGLGRNEDAGPYASSLEMAAFPFMPYHTCAAFFKESDDEFLGKGKNLTQEASICLRGRTDSCQLDIGSGIFQWRGDDRPPILIGLANRATQECSYGAPFVFTNISSHIPWLSEKVDVFKDINRFDRQDVACGEIKTAPRLSGGSPATPGRYPYAVSIRPKGHLHRCNGVLISAHHVLTTASCVDKRVYLTSTHIEAYIGGIMSDPDSDSTDSELIQVSGYYPHPHYHHHTRSVNLAVLTLERKSTKKPIHLPYHQRKCCEDGLRLRVVGFGSRSSGEAHATVLQEGDVGYVSKRKCKERYNVHGLNPVSICAGDDETGVGAGLCRGDDGTPLILTGGAEDVLIGLGFSNTSGGCDGGQPAEFLKVAFFMKWIKIIIHI